MSLVLFRVDDRLIHGQVITGWSKNYSADVIYVIDDKVAADDFLKQVMVMAAPPNVTVKVYSVEEGIAELKKETQEKAIVLTKTPSQMKALLDSGIVIKEINIGGMGTAPGRKNVLRNIQISKEEVDLLREMEKEFNVHVFFQVVPGDKSIELNKVKI